LAIPIREDAEVSETWGSCAVTEDRRLTLSNLTCSRAGERVRRERLGFFACIWRRRCMADEVPWRQGRLMMPVVQKKAACQE